MKHIDQSLIHVIRKFNRFYTNVLGLLDQHMLDSEFSLSEARVLYEIGHTENCTAKRLIEELRVDPGYLSRIIKRFEKHNLIYRIQSAEDGRLFYLHLTEGGITILGRLNAVSDQQVSQMVNSLAEQDQKKLTDSMKNIESILEGSSNAEDKIRIRSELKAGDVGWLIHLHGWVYAKECGYNAMFEGYVCKTFHEFFEKYSPVKDKFWFAEADGEIVGAIAVVGHNADKAQLRWFILHPRFRGIGLGRTLFQEAILYCKEKAYKQVFLATTQDQQTAIRLYRKAGFRKIAAHENDSWGKKLVEEIYELDLA
ncbi:bifunctional helix-turn-helix transcriptional regulator/GNAT family N-acetyltransferase [bacterium BFN5]|nr:bifunctional helix-turn-helix transcriptional regulator/GNAT family N-acetyltransferase [bacterium BFN5]